jgi:iron complex transport system substrate-binding protein
MLFAGKYSEPDYELLLAQNCDLAIESTMILHSPEVQEKLETLGIPVLIDRSSYESDPLGRTEWIKLYGELTDHQEEADQWFSEQKSYVEALQDFENTGKTVAFFYINDSGMVVTRKNTDYIPKMIEQAGGTYIFDKLGDDSSGSSSVTMSMEEFYASAMSADYLIYNATIENSLDSVDELLEKSPLFADFKAVENGNVWCTGKYLYQATDVIGSMIKDIHTMLTDEKVKELSFMTRLQ